MGRTGGGYFLGHMSLRLALFLDAQNVYYRARHTFFADTGPHVNGQINPGAVAELIAARGGPQGAPVQVQGIRIYTGFHTQGRNPLAYSSHRRQRAFWEGQGCVVTSRPLRYLGQDARSGREKGVDVALAVDYIDQATRSEFDIGVIFSMDSDLSPALEFVKNRNELGVVPATAAWYGEGPYSQINVSGVWCHRLSRADYDAVHDPTDYARSAT